MILLKAWTNGACLNEAAYAVIHASPEWARTALPSMEMAKEIKIKSMWFNYISFFNSVPLWMPWSEVLSEIMNGEEIPEAIGPGSPERVGQEVYLIGEELWMGIADYVSIVEELGFLRVDGSTARVEETSIYWRARLHNTDAIATTAEISKELLERIAKGGSE